MFLRILREETDDQGRDRIEDALAPPLRVNSATGLPFGWDAESELEGFDAALTG